MILLDAIAILLLCITCFAQQNMIDKLRNDLDSYAAISDELDEVLTQVNEKHHAEIQELKAKVG